MVLNHVLWPQMSKKIIVFFLFFVWFVIKKEMFIVIQMTGGQKIIKIVESLS